MNSNLLSQIQKGKALKKAQTNDRSAPIIDDKPKQSAPMGNMPRPPIPGMAPPSLSHTSSAPAIHLPSAPQLGGLFANGMPTLRKTRGAAVETNRGSPSVPPPPPPTMVPPSPNRAPTFNRPSAAHSSNTLPRNFRAPPPIPGRPSTPSAPSTSTAPPPPPPPAMGHSNNIASGLSPRTQANLIPTLPGRARSNSSPQRPIPPTPPRAIPSPPGSPIRTPGSPRAAPKVPLPHKPTSGLAVPPPLPPGRPRSASNATPTASPLTRSVISSFTPTAPIPPPPPPPVIVHANPITTPPRSPLPPPPPVLNNRNHAPSVPRSTTSFRNTLSLTEGNGRYTFRPTSDLPPPRMVHRDTTHIYPSGETKGNAYPLDPSKFQQ
ncbi:hypothetical protein BDB01DRAFT_793170 [Pilobolus umbonatus]|nr:hypothetical protein BDB01DRAFT_793170 [Pilobolus umbonatus]